MLTVIERIEGEMRQKDVVSSLCVSQLKIKRLVSLLVPVG